MTKRTGSRRQSAVSGVALLAALAGCGTQTVDVAPAPPTEAIPIDPSHPVKPDYTNYAQPHIALYVAYQPNRYVLLSANGVLIPRQCVFVAPSFRIVVIVKNPKGVAYVQVGNPPYTIKGLPPQTQPSVAFSVPSATPGPDSPTQTTALASGPYANPGAWPGSRSVEVNYLVNSTDRVYDNAMLNVEVTFAPNLAPQDAYAPIRIFASTPSSANGSIDGFVVRRAGPGDRPGSDCPWQDLAVDQRPNIASAWARSASWPSFSP